MTSECHKVRFNMNRESDQEAWSILQAVPSGKRSRFVIEAITAYAQKQAEGEQQEQLAERIADLVAERLSDCSFSSSVTEQNNATEPDADVMERNLANAEDFLSHWC